MQLHWVVDLHRQTIQRAAGGERKANCKHQCAPTLPEGNRLRGIDAPTPARTVGLPPRRGTYFLSKRKKVPKKAGGTATPEAARPAARRGLRSAVAPSGLSSTSVRCAHPPGKRLLLPILTAGLAMSRAMTLDSFHKLLERARARLFPPSKWAGLFPSAAYRRSAPPQLAHGIISPCGVGCFGVACVFLQGQRPAGNQIHAGLFREP